MNNGMEKEIIEVSLEDIIPNRFQPRLVFDDKALNELATSIKEHGIVQPLVLRKAGDKYEIIAGERRYKAATMAGLKTVPAIVMNVDDQKSAEIAVVENIQRRDLTPLEEAKSYKKLLDKNYLTQEQLASRMGKAQATISNKMRLLNLDEEVQNALLNSKISERHARSLLNLKNPEDQRAVLQQIISNRLTVKQTDDLIKTMVKPAGTMEASEFATTMDENNNETNQNMEGSMESNNNVGVDNIDINRIKEESVDINPEKETPDFNKLLGVEGGNNLAPSPDTIKENMSAPEPAQNKFIPIFEPDEEEEVLDMGPKEAPQPTVNNDVNNFGFNIDNLNDNNSFNNTNTNDLIAEYRQAQTEPVIPTVEEAPVSDLKTAINMIRTLSNSLEKSGFVIDVEEFDFENQYQVIFKINK